MGQRASAPQGDAIVSVKPQAPFVPPPPPPPQADDSPAIRAAGGLPAYQGTFFNNQKQKYQEIEPNRLQPERVNGPLGDEIVNGMSALLSEYDPYLDSIQGPQISAPALSNVLQGQATVTDEEKKCRSYQGYGGLLRLINDQAANPYAPVRCGWRYKAPGNMSLVPQVAQGALGRRQGPLNNRASEDTLAGGVRWFWNLEEARRQMLKDMSRFFRTPQSVALAQSMPGASDMTDIRWAWCASTRKAIPVDLQGKPIFADVPGWNCPPQQTITNVRNLPQNPSVTSLDRSNSQALSDIQQCINSSKAGTPLSRDCLLMAVRSAGCADTGTLYHAVSRASPNDAQYDRFLNNSQAFQKYQSTQGSNGLTAQMFRRDQATWSGAVNSVGTLARNTANPSNAVRVSAQDLCNNSGAYESYDFCADLTDNSPIQEAGLNCLQRYWNESNGKPAGEAYPNSVTSLHPALGNPTTWGAYKQAVNRLRQELNASDPTRQRDALRQFTGAVVIREAHKAYRDSPWVKLPGTWAKQVSTDGKTVCAVNWFDQIFCKEGLPVKPGGEGAQGWITLPGRLKYISVSNGKVYGVNSQDQIWYADNYRNAQWRQIPGALKMVEIDGNVVCGVNSADQIFCKDDLESANWVRIPGWLKHVAINNGRLYGVNAYDEIYYADNYTNAQWRQIPGALKQVDFDGNVVCGVNRNDEIWCKEGLGGAAWQRIPGALQHISVANFKTYGTNRQNDMWSRT